ncbi:MAG: hypothetical protein ABJF04_21075 [Reichenbachiella sp.]|uniref:hypothetical protein n=1 Tax=Reichenbachiella sp. TaxID=2184521 RepID=UPI003265F9B0
MKQLWNYLAKYLNENFHLGLYLSVAAFIAICTYLNFTYDFEDSVVDSYHKTWLHWFYMSLYMGFPFLVACGLLTVFKVNTVWFRSGEFWLLFIFGFILIGFSRTLYYHYALIDHLGPIDHHFARKVLWRAKSFFTLFIPLLLFYYFYEKKKDEHQSWYGLSLRQTDFKPYAILLLAVVVGIGLASFLSDLTNYYPRYLYSGGGRFAEQHELAVWIPMIFYEGIYGSNFLNVELFFRGFLVIGFARVLGGHAVLAMVGSYVFLHFGKPMTEAISSAFGGYFIGILAFYSKRIWGGVVLHVALAWSMEFFAWLQRLYADS